MNLALSAQGGQKNGVGVYRWADGSMCLGQLGEFRVDVLVMFSLMDSVEWFMGSVGISFLSENSCILDKFKR